MTASFNCDAAGSLVPVVRVCPLEVREHDLPVQGVAVLDEGVLDHSVRGLTFDWGRRFKVRVVSTYTIGETAERSGFSASALRYYEGIGLVAPSTRTGAGYRIYDDETLSRLSFIARAKQLGCSLEEITDLAGIWDGERCGPVQRRFHDLVTTKLADAERQIAELAALADQLRHAAAQLAGPAIDGPCSEDCACVALDVALAPVTLTTKEHAR